MTDLDKNVVFNQISEWKDLCECCSNNNTKVKGVCCEEEETMYTEIMNLRVGRAYQDTCSFTANEVLRELVEPECAMASNKELCIDIIIGGRIGDGPGGIFKRKIFDYIHENILKNKPASIELLRKLLNTKVWVEGKITPELVNISTGEIILIESNTLNLQTGQQYLIQVIPKFPKSINPKVSEILTKSFIQNNALIYSEDKNKGLSISFIAKNKDTQQKGTKALLLPTYDSNDLHITLHGVKNGFKDKRIYTNSFSIKNINPIAPETFSIPLTIK